MDPKVDVLRVKNQWSEVALTPLNVSREGARPSDNFNKSRHVKKKMKKEQVETSEASIFACPTAYTEPVRTSWTNVPTL
jgi:hypothetical protein